MHGGPASAAKPGWPTVAGALASQGFYVLLPNPRGSYGQGEAFTRGNVKDFGYGDFRDILAGVDAVLKRYPVDPDRLAIAGWSVESIEPQKLMTTNENDAFVARLDAEGMLYSREDLLPTGCYVIARNLR